MASVLLIGIYFRAVVSEIYGNALSVIPTVFFCNAFPHILGTVVNYDCTLTAYRCGAYIS